MIDQPAYVKVLLKKYLDGTATAAELAQLMVAWDVYDDDELSDMIAELTGDYKNSEIGKEENELPVEEEPAMLGKEITAPGNKSLKKGSRYDRIFFISFAIIIAYLLVWLFTRPGAKPFQFSCNGVPGNTELPTSPYSCKLILANGSSRVINSTSNGLVIQERGLAITQTEPGLLVFRSVDSVASEKPAPMYITLETAPGQQYKVVLPDGSHVRLNAASSVRFPVGFSMHKRKLYLKGEALFDIVPDSSSPFYVYTGNAELKLRGATFNVNAYLQKTVVTLLNGQLEIKTGSSTATLTGGKHAMAVANAQPFKQTITLTEGDTISALSWKKATRMYKNVPMREFVSDIGRWYNLEIVNLSCIPASAHISVAMCYNTPIDQLLTIFSDSKLKFYKVGKRITFCDPTLRAVPAQTVPFKQAL